MSYITNINYNAYTINIVIIKVRTKNLDEISRTEKKTK